MPIDTVLAELKSMHGGAAPVVGLSNADIERWSADLAISTEALYDMLALRLAQGFHRDELPFSFCDYVVNEIHAVITVGNQIRPDLFWRVYLAFDEGEYHHRGDNRDEDPVAKYTRTQIAQIVEEYTDRLV